MKITRIAKNSLGAQLGLHVGDLVNAINGSRVRDILDYRFKIAEENLVLQVRKNGRITEYTVEKDYDDDLGLEFEDFPIRKCANDCIFCFVDQNPKGMREALYFRDGDFRLSFLHGHYITMTNMGRKELQRVVDQHLSPLYISVHVTDPDLRKKMFLYRKDDHLLEKFKFLTSQGIELHSQIVLCPTWNDGDVLKKTIADIHQFTPRARSLSIVPVGLTGHREGLPDIPVVTREYARNFLTEARKLDELYRLPDGKRFIFLSDEWFLKIGNELPEMRYYNDVDLVENGVGQVTTFMEQWQRKMKRIAVNIVRPLKITIGSGTLIAEFFREKFIPMLNAIPGLTVNYQPIRNDFFGADQVTITGLLTGQDIVRQLAGKELGDLVLFSDRIFRETGTVTLDDMHGEEITAALDTPFQVTSDDPAEFFQILSGC
ncbi:MAG: DUF512 domain-containing protein [Fidelibacterota bacterium]